MLGSIINALFLGWFLIVGLNFSIQDLSALTDSLKEESAFTILCKQTVGGSIAIFLNLIIFVGKISQRSTLF